MTNPTKNRLHAACLAVVPEMIITGMEPADLQARFDSVYGEGTYKITVHWGCDYVANTWRASSEMDFVTGYGDEIKIFLKREKA